LRADGLERGQLDVKNFTGFGDVRHGREIARKGK